MGQIKPQLLLEHSLLFIAQRTSNITQHNLVTDKRSKSISH